MSPGKAAHPIEGLPHGVNNQGLFSDYYLAELVHEDDFFRNSAKDTEQIWHAIKSTYEKVKDRLLTANGDQVEHLCVHSELDALAYKDLYTLKPDRLAISFPELRDVFSRIEHNLWCFSRFAVSPSSQLKQSAQLVGERKRVYQETLKWSRFLL